MINPRYQLKYMFWVSSTGLLFLLALNLAFYYYMRENYVILVELSPMEDAVKALLQKEMHQLVLIQFGVGLLFLGVISISGMFFSHRTAGPLYHFKRVFKEVAKGDVSIRIRLRRRDNLKDVAQCFNEMMDTIEKKVKAKEPD